MTEPIILKKANILGLGALVLGNIWPVVASKKVSQVRFGKISSENLPPCVQGISESTTPLPMERGNSMPLLKASEKPEAAFVKAFCTAVLKNEIKAVQSILQSFKDDKEAQKRLLNSRAGGLPMPLLTFKIEQAHQENREVLDFLIGNSLVDVNATYGNGRTPLKSAILCDDFKTAQRLLAREDLKPAICSDFGITALHVAIVKRKTRFIQLLLTHHFKIEDHFMKKWDEEQKEMFSQGLGTIRSYLEKPEEPTSIQNLEETFKKLHDLIMGY